jgi:hypothetical protein
MLRPELRTRFRRAAILMTVCLLPLAGCGNGDKEARQKEAAEIAKAVEAYIALMEQPNQPVGLHHEKVTVTPSESDKSYAVAVTGLKFAGQTGEALVIGEIDYKLTPGDGQTYQVADLKLPPEITFAGADGKPSATAKMETTAFSGVWSSTIQNFLKLDWQVKNFAVTDVAHPDAKFTADALGMTIDGKDKGNGRLDQALAMSVSGISVDDPAEDTSLKIAKLSGDLNVDNFDYATYRTQMLKLRDMMTRISPALEQKAEGAAPADPTVALTDADRAALAEILAALPKAMPSYSYAFKVEGIADTAKDGSTPFKLASGGMDFALKGLDGDKAELDLGFQHDGLELSGAEFEDPMLKAVLPKSGSLGLQATEIPVSTIMSAVAKQIPQLTSVNPDEAKGAQIQLMGVLYSALAQSTLQMKVRPSHLTSDKASLTADGALQLALSSPSMTVGQLNLALAGLDDLSALANDLSAQSPAAMQAVGFLQMLHQLAKRETGSDGKPLDKYLLDFAPGGAITVNGQPLDGILQ